MACVGWFYGFELMIVLVTFRWVFIEGFYLSYIVISGFVWFLEGNSQFFSVFRIGRRFLVNIQC